MSWGERSCKHFCNDCNEHPQSDLDCNCMCKSYEWDGKSAPDSAPMRIGEREKFLDYTKKKIAEYLPNDSDESV